MAAAAQLLQEPVDGLEPPQQLGGAKPQANRYPSLFSPDTDEEFSDDHSSDLEELTHSPLLHISEVIKQPPSSFEAALEILLPRLQPTSDVKGVSIEDQESFVAILVGELSCQFSVLHHQIDDPFLDERQNKQLHRQISIDVCTTIEQVYGEFIYKAAVLNKNPLTLSSSMAMLRAQLMIEANKRLNIPSIRRRVLKKLRGGGIVSEPVVDRICTGTSRLPPIPKAPAAPVEKIATRHSAELEDLELGSSLDTKLSRFGVRWNSGAIRRRIAKLERRLPKATAVPAPMGSGSSDEETEEDEDAMGTAGRPLRRLLREKSQGDTEVPSQIKKPPFPRLPRVSSNPELWGDFILCDLGWTTRQKRPESIRAKESLLGLHRPPSVEDFMNLRVREQEDGSGKARTLLGDYTLPDLNQDLLNLEERRCVSQQSFTEDDLHPLLQAHVHGLSVKQVARLADYEAALKKEEQVASERTPSPGTSSLLDQSIPSVPTLDQLPYLTIEHASGSSFSNPSLHVKSGLEKKGPAAAGSELDGRSTSYECSSTRMLGSGSGYLEDASGQGEAQVSARTESQLSQGKRDVDVTTPATDTIKESSLLERSGGSSMVATPTLQSPQTASAGGERGDSEKAWGEDMLYGQHSRESSEDRTALSRGTGVEDEVDTSHFQTAVVTATYPGQGVVRTSDIRVSERVPLIQTRQKFFGPIYNELAEDWDSGITEELDSNLHEGKEVTALYEEIMKTLPANHLKFSTEPTLEPSLSAVVDLSKIVASRTLLHRRSQRIINPSLHRDIPPPWGTHTDRKTWEESNQYKGADLELHENSASPYAAAEMSHNYNTWLSNWKSTVDPEDYFKFCSKKDSDYLRLVYHLYDSEGSDSEDEAEQRQKREKLAALKAKLRAKEARKRERYQAKNLYTSGMWNVNTVIMGGLGEDPNASSNDEEEDKENFTSLTGKASTLGAVQKNLQRIWTRLHVPAHQQIDMAIKYSGDITQTKLHKILEMWDCTCDAIEKREAALAQLEAFEKKASDPSRFFAQGRAGSATVRLNEARERDRLHSVLDRLDKRVSFLLRRLHNLCGDTVTYKGRPYAEKMRLDRTEMLYWLQQARRQAVVRPSIKTLDELFVVSTATS